MLWCKWMLQRECGSVRGHGGGLHTSEIARMSFTINEAPGLVIDKALVQSVTCRGSFWGACSRPCSKNWLQYRKHLQSKENTKNWQSKDNGPARCDDLPSTEVNWNVNQIYFRQRLPQCSKSTTKDSDWKWNLSPFAQRRIINNCAPKCVRVLWSSPQMMRKRIVIAWWFVL